jgi:hypothetical protein
MGVSPARTVYRTPKEAARAKPANQMVVEGRAARVAKRRALQKSPVGDWRAGISILRRD